MPSSLSFTMLDYNGETSLVNLNMRPVTALNFPTFLSDTGALRTAIDNITLGTVQSEKGVAFNTPISSIPPTDKTAQVELKWLVTYVDTTPEYAVGVPNPGFGKKFQNEIATANPALIVNQTEFMDLTVNPGLAFKNAFEAAVVSPYQGQPQVLSIQLVGRTR